MKVDMNMNLLITQLRNAAHELGYAEGRIEAVKDYCEHESYPSAQTITTILGILPDKHETKDDLSDALQYTD